MNIIIKILINKNFSSNTDFNKLSFNPQSDNVVEFLDSYERCFNLLKEEDRMKVNLIKFVSPRFLDKFNKYMVSHSYQETKRKFVDLHISTFTEFRHDQLNVEFISDQVTEFIKKKSKALKKFITSNEDLIVKLVLSSMPNETADLFYLHGMCKTLDDLNTFALSLDHFDDNDSSINNSRVNCNDATDLNSNMEENRCISLIELARSERNAGDVHDPIFLPLSNNSESLDKTITDDNSDSNNSPCPSLGALNSAPLSTDTTLAFENLEDHNQTASSCVSNQTSIVNKSSNIHTKKRRIDEYQLSYSNANPKRSKRLKNKNK